MAGLGSSDRRWRSRALALGALLLAGCGAPAASPTSSHTPSATATRSTPAPGITVDPCVVGTWVGGSFSGPHGSGLAGLVLQVSNSGHSMALLDNTTPIGSPPTSFQGQATLVLGTSVIHASGGTSNGTLTVASDDDSNIQTTSGGVSAALPGTLWDSALYSCTPTTLTLSFQTTAGGYLGGSSVTLSR